MTAGIIAGILILVYGLHTFRLYNRMKKTGGEEMEKPDVTNPSKRDRKGGGQRRTMRGADTHDALARAHTEVVNGDMFVELQHAGSR